MSDCVRIFGAAGFFATTSLTTISVRRWRACRAVAMFAPAIAAGLFCLANPVVALAQESPAKGGVTLPPGVIDSPKPKPKRVAAKRPPPSRAVATRGGDRSGQAAQEAPVVGAGAPTPAQAA